MNHPVFALDHYRASILSDETAFAFLGLLLRDGAKLDRELSEELGKSVSYVKNTAFVLGKAGFVAALQAGEWSLTAYALEALRSMDLDRVALESWIASTHPPQVHRNLIDACFRTNETPHGAEMALLTYKVAEWIVRAAVDSKLQWRHEPARLVDSLIYSRCPEAYQFRTSGSGLSERGATTERIASAENDARETNDFLTTLKPPKDDSSKATIYLNVLGRFMQTIVGGDPDDLLTATYSHDHRTLDRVWYQIKTWEPKAEDAFHYAFARCHVSPAIEIGSICEAVGQRLRDALRSRSSKDALADEKQPTSISAAERPLILQIVELRKRAEQERSANLSGSDKAILRRETRRLSRALLDLATTETASDANEGTKTFHEQ